MDALSDILQTIHLRSSVYFRRDFSAPWGMRIDAGEFAQFHLIVRGQCFLQDQHHTKPLALSGGDIVVFPTGETHSLCDRPGRRLHPGRKVVESLQRGETIFKGDGPATTLVCGHFEFDRTLDHPFLRDLPSLIHLTDTDRRQLRWLETSTNIIIQEAGSANPGADVVVNRLTEVLFIQIVRAYMLQNEVSEGYLAALKDGQISEALRIIHSAPQISWTLENIARNIGMSRSAFARRFKQLVGLTPMDYLTRWRMEKARELLNNRKLSIIDIAEQVGYLSEAAFSRAFKRRFRQTPGALRRALQN